MEEPKVTAGDNEPNGNGGAAPTSDLQLVLGPTTRSIFRRIIKWTCLFALLIWVVLVSILLLIIWYILFRQALPMRRAYYLETDYQRALIQADTSPLNALNQASPVVATSPTTSSRLTCPVSVQVWVHKEATGMARKRG
jgi:hypothetical protein